MAEPLRLMIQGTDTVAAYACGECRVIYGYEEMARKCCSPRVCGCGAAIAYRYYTACDDCRRKADEKRADERFEKAPRVSRRDHNGPVCESEYGDKYHPDTESFVDEWMSYHDALPAYVWACETRRLELDAEEIVRQELERSESDEDANDRVEGIDELQKAMNEWVERHPVEWWVPNGMVVMLDGYPVDEE